MNEARRFAQSLVNLLWQALEFIWNWSFGQIVRMFGLNFATLPIWKQVLFVLVIAALVYFLYKVFKDLVEAVTKVLGAIVGLIGALVSMLPQIVYAGLVAFGGAWLINNITLPLP